MQRLEVFKNYISGAAKHIALALVLVANLTACSDAFSRPDATKYPRTESVAIPQTTATSLGKSLADDIKAHPRKSGFRLLTTGNESFKYRLAMIQAAEKTIDLQYYAMHDDGSANLLLEAILHAAARGVRVRFLIDNISMREVGKSLGVLDGVKNIEIRVFNPPSTRHQSYVGQVVSWMNDINKVFKRMHNKALISDNQLAIIGGRNLGDEYFEADSNSDFKDIDILTAGPITARISNSFDRYWNDENSFPIGTIQKPFQTRREIEQLREDLKEHWDEALRNEERAKILQSNLSERLKAGEVGLIWASAELRADDPEKVDKDSEEAESKPLNRLEQLTQDAKHEFIIISSYLVPQEEGVEWIKDLIKRGVKVKILTNSLASTDVVAVHTGYKRYRRALLESGAELYEFKPVGDSKPRQRLIGSTAPATASLHSKVYVIDRSSVLVGSFNLDPRSVSLNTEIAIVVHSPEIAEQVAKIFEDATSPGSSYELLLEEDGDMQWVTEEKNKKEIYHHDPEALMRRIQVFFMSMLPLEEQL